MNFHRRRSLSYLVLLCIVGCEPSDGDGPVPVALEEKPPCVISADCPAGQHCDLGQCTQSCNADDPCDDGQSCTSRARCIAPGEPDADPEPEVEFRGEVSVSPEVLLLAPDATTMSFTLSTTATGPVRYRLESTAPHVRIDVPRGVVEGSTTITLRVDGSAVRTMDAHGGVRVITELGERYVDAPMQAGLTGYYQGTMTYGNDTLPLGSASLALELVDQSGTLAVRADPEWSLLFPTTGSAGGPRPATGMGRFTSVDGLVDFTLLHDVGADFGGERNPFDRRVVRSIRFLLHPGVAPGSLEGTFTEEITGLLPTTLRASGGVVLAYAAEHPVGEIVVGTAAAMPSVPNGGRYLPPSENFGWSSTTCRNAVGEVCDLLPADQVSSCRNNPSGAASALHAALRRPLRESFSGHVGEGAYTELAEACSASIALDSRAQLDGSPAARCGMIAPLACLLDPIQNGGGDEVANGELYSQVLADFLAPGLLVGNDSLVQGLVDSFVIGTNAERLRYEEALAQLRPFARWAAQPAVLSYLRGMPPEAARGDASRVADTFPGLRSMADLFALTASLESEVARIESSTGAVDRKAAARRTQERALVTLLQSLAVADALQAWRSADPDLVVPETIDARFLGVLSPLDRSLSATLQGANVFGIPEAFVPFVYRPGGEAPTNFEQMLALARSGVQAEEIVEHGWREGSRQFESNEERTRTELQQIRLNYDDRLRSICGSSFDPSRPNWLACTSGTNGGAMGERVLAIRAAEGQVRIRRAALEAQKDRVVVAQNTAARVLRLRVENLTFQVETGAQIIAISQVQFILGSIVKGLEIAANAELWNGGAPVAMGVVATALQLVSGGLDITKQQLTLSQTAHSLRTDLLVEQEGFIREIQNEWITFNSLAVEAQESAVGVLQAKLAARNLLDEAHSIWEERQRSIAELDRSTVRDPSHRLIRDRQALAVLRARATAQRQLSMAARALQYEINLPIGAVDGAVMAASNASSMRTLLICLEGIYGDDRSMFPSPVEYETRISVREMLGISGERTDAVTGEVLSAGEQFRQLLLAQQNLDGEGGVGVEFTTSLAENNGLWAADLCRDRITSTQAEIIGDFLGDGEAQVNLLLDGTGFLRDCSTETIVPWTFGSSDAASAVAVIQAGVNAPGTGAPNTSLYGQPVSRAAWHLLIPGPARAPANRDLDLTRVEDVILVVRHAASPQRASALEYDLSCLQSAP